MDGNIRGNGSGHTSRKSLISVAHTDHLIQTLPPTFQRYIDWGWNMDLSNPINDCINCIASTLFLPQIRVLSRQKLSSFIAIECSNKRRHRPRSVPTDLELIRCTTNWKGQGQATLSSMLGGKGGIPTQQNENLASMLAPPVAGPLHLKAQHEAPHTPSTCTPKSVAAGFAVLCSTAG